jgi:5'-methylthioadenosine phosphorylase
MIGVIGGSGLYELLDGAEAVKVSTPWGDPSAPIAVGSVGGVEVAFLPRHGRSHETPAHRVSYRANLWALHQLGVRRVVASCAVGSVSPDIAPGDYVVLDQFIDLTSNRQGTFFDGPVLAHVSTADPYCPDIGAVLASAVEAAGATAHRGGTVAVISGPRFSTRAESRWIRSMGADVVNMTQAPEAALARELRMCFAGLAMVTDRDVDGEGGGEPVSMDAVFGRLKEMASTVKEVVAACAESIDRDPSCGCATLGADLSSLC